VSDAALRRLREALPGFENEACLLKAVAVNSLYGTRLYALARMARHVQTVLAGADLRLAPIQLADQIAAMPRGPNEDQHRFTSFAAKFCHFFIDEERFPIYDEAARTVLKLHLNGADFVHDEQHPYVAFVSNFMRLKSLSGFVGSTRDLDRYLWLTGMYMKWIKTRNRKSVPVNVELQHLFNAPGIEAAQELECMLPAQLPRLLMLGAGTKRR